MAGMIYSDEIVDGALRFNEERYHESLFSDGEDSDHGNVLEDLKSIGDNRCTETENEECGSDLQPKVPEDIEALGQEFTEGLTHGIRFEDMCPLTPADSAWCSCLKGKDLKKLSKRDFDEISFDTLEEAEKFYYYYAFMMGFSVKKYRKEKRIVGDVAVTWRRTYACSKQGVCNSKKKQKEDAVDPKEAVKQNSKMQSVKVLGKMKRKVVKRGIKSTRTKCLANLTLKLDLATGQYRVFRFETTHNHGLAAVFERHYLRSFREVTTEDILEVEALQSANVGISAAYDYLVKQAGGLNLLVSCLRTCITNCTGSGD